MSEAIFSAIFLAPVLWEAFRQARAIKIDGQLLLSLSFSIVYGYTGLTYFFSENSSGYLIRDGQAITVSVVCATSYLFAILGYWLGKQIAARRTQNRAITGPDCRFEDYLAIKWASCAAYAIALISLAIYSSSYGGFDNAFRFAAKIRAGYGENLLIGSGELLFFKNLIPLSVYLPILYFALYARRRKLFDLLVAIVSISVPIAGFLLMSGRGRIVAFIIMIVACAIAFAPARKRNPAFLFVLGPFTLLLLDLFVTFGKKFFSSFYRDHVNWSDVFVLSDYVPFKAFTDYYEHRITSIDSALSASEQSYTYFYDFISIPLFVLPHKLTGIVEPESISYLNTYLQTGVWDSMVPPGIAAYGIYSFGIFGVVIAGVVFGFLPGLLDGVNSREGTAGNPRVFFRIPLILIWIVYLFQGDPRVLSVHLTPVLMFGAIYYFAQKAVAKKDRRSSTQLFDGIKNRRVLQGVAGFGHYRT